MDLITSVIDGYTCCILAYGQTGSGKTYTMQGTGAHRGPALERARIVNPQCRADRFLADG